MQLPHGLFIFPTMAWHCYCGACFCWSDGELMGYVSAKSLKERRKNSSAKWNYSKTQWRAWTHLNCITAAVGVVFQRSNKILPKGFFWSTNTSHLVSGSGNRVGDCADKGHFEVKPLLVLLLYLQLNRLEKRFYSMYTSEYNHFQHVFLILKCVKTTTVTSIFEYVIFTICRQFTTISICRE